MILVTGGTGLNGRAVVDEFVRAGHPVRVLVRRLAKASEAGLDHIAGIELVEADMTRAETLGAALDGVTRVLMISSSAPDMVETQCRFIDACKQAGVGHVVKFSGAESGIGFDPSQFRFTRMHEQIEDYLEASGLAWTHLRPSQFMQVYLREVPDIVSKGELRLPFADIRLSPVHVGDIARVAHRLLRDGGYEGERLDMTGPEALTMNDVAARLSTATGRNIRYVPVSLEARRQAVLASGVPAAFADALDELAAERLRRPQARVYLGTHEAFDVRPTTFAQFAESHADVFRGK
ncbi:SDR family oxidoreductase [Trinickia sp. LjRoot230]|uniref:SDR family oxidoreductase n=1 Tax=Trinickia sp. LjRoot230 TaxID=3342288 RepID=UPI003ECF949D